MKEFPKKYSRTAVEEKWKEVWEREGVYRFTYDPAKPMYSVDTPPPYVSADHLHAGHIMSYAQAEFIVRFKRMRGYNVFYPMGFDDNGLPTERFVEKKHNIDKSKITRSEFIKLCLEETEKGSATYKKLWNDLGISVDWSKTYSTIAPLAVEVSQRSLIDIHKKGGLYRSRLPILWCPFCETALAQADLEDKEEESFMNYINFSSHEGKDLLIATTRPELIPACVALYANPKDTRHAHLIGSEATVPLMGYTVPIKASEKVSLETGTGLMMVCTWGDQEDVEKWREDALETRALVTENGKLSELGGKYAGLALLEARKQMLADLKEAGKLVKQEKLTHTLNVHERCSTPVEFVLSRQWFIKVADKKDVWHEFGSKLTWYPDYKKKDYEMWVDSLKWDWCISRQRYYGVPFPVWYCTECEEPVFARDEDLPVYPTEQKPHLEKCPKCGATEFVPEEDVMDTWATSSCTPFLIRELVRDNKAAYDALFPATLRPNAFEIIRTWDFYSVVKAYYNFSSIPFTDVMISGHGLDSTGRKFSKRLGNYIPSDKLLEQYGSDPIRFWATGATLGQNLRFSEQEVDRGKRTVTKLWNVARFIAMWSEGYEHSETAPALEDADIWILKELNKTIRAATESFEAYTYARSRDEVEAFFWSKVADYYVEFIKYRLSGTDESSKKAALWTMHTVFSEVLKMYAPVMPFITEELYSLLYADARGEKSIHLSSWPEPREAFESTDTSEFAAAIALIDEIRKYKSDNNLSLGAEIDTYAPKTEINKEKYAAFVQNVMRVKELK